MASWCIVGSTRGIGFEFVNQLSSNPKNTVLALIRSQNTAGQLNELAKSRKNIHVIETDIANPSRLKETVEKVGNVTGRKLDVLIYNAYSAGTEGNQWPPSAFTDNEEALEREIFEPLKVNLLQMVSSVNAFLPLIRNGDQKKAIYITSGIADVNFSRVAEMPGMLGYSVSKASGNIMMAKFAVELRKDGIKTLSLSPGWVETDAANSFASNPEAFQYMLSAFQAVKPSVQGMISTKESVKDQLAVIDDLDASKSGMFVSQHGNDDWF